MARLKLSRRLQLQQMVAEVVADVFGETASREDHELIMALLKHRVRGVTNLQIKQCLISINRTNQAARRGER